MECFATNYLRAYRNNSTNANAPNDPNIAIRASMTPQLKRNTKSHTQDKEVEALVEIAQVQRLFPPSDAKKSVASWGHIDIPKGTSVRVILLDPGLVA